MNCTTTYITFPELLIWFPVLAGVLSFFIRNQGAAKAWAMLASILTLGISLTGFLYTDMTAERDFCLNNVSYEWLKYIGSSFALGMDGMGRMLTLLTAISFPLIFMATYRRSYSNSGSFYGLMLLTQAGLMGVFTAMDALVFYIFWELALIPVYFLCSRWGGERRIAATFKFFVYTFAGSLLMLVGILYVYNHTLPVQGFAEHSFSWKAFQNAQLTAGQQNGVFWLFFIAFAIKMPVFPFHTWQPDAYEQSPAPATMVLSGIMVKMGIFAVIRWLLPVLPAASHHYANIVIGLSVAGMIYASCIAMMQDDLKRLAAYSSIAHIGLMCAAVFTGNSLATQGVMVQMFSHGINIIGLWIVIEMIEKQLGVRKLSQLGGIAHKAPVLTILLVVMALANIALPLTNAFVGEFMMFGGLFQHSKWMTAIAGISIILAAIYTLTMIQKVFLGEPNTLTARISDISWNEKLVLAALVVAVFMVGVFPQPMLDMVKDSVVAVLTKFKNG
jgi:NADH-quinone oxidoreductase subunit M